MRLFKVCGVALLVIGWMLETAAQNQPPSSTPPDKNQDSAQPAPRPCSKSRLVDFKVTRDGEDPRDVAVWQTSGSPAFFYESGMYIDADGAPNAYNPQDTGLDDLANAGEPGHWYALAKDDDGEPYVQGDGAAFPGYYVSTTALSDRTKEADDPGKYVDASKIPYIVLPHAFAREMGAHLGDFAVVLNLRNGKSSNAIFADVGPENNIGEGSMALADGVGVRSNPRRGGASRGIIYLIFPGSGNGQPRPIEEINAQATKLFDDWGGSVQLTACSAR
jgi:Fungal chitosanase of glycosyl hydrolase group 75